MKNSRILIEYKDETEVLESLKIGVINSFDTLYIENIKMYEFYERSSVSEEYYQWDLFEINISEVIPVMNALKEDITQIQLYDRYSEEAGEPYLSYKFQEFWEILKKQDPWNFLIGIVTIIQRTDRTVTQTSLTLLINTIKEQLKLHDIRYINLINKQIFVAMAFSEDMTKARQAICDAVRACGYNPVLIDIKEHNNFIVPEIFSEIEKSDYVIADLTNQRAGVYFEAGYALGLQIPVILSCKETDFENNHFDVAQINTILWEKAADLKERLINRIEALDYQRS